MPSIKNRLAEIAYVQRHRKEVQRIAKEHGYSFPFHDFVKMIMIFLFGDTIATRIHRKFSHHHAQFIWIYVHMGKHIRTKIFAGRDIKNKIEAAIDWESARFTKPDKPLDAYDTWKEYYSDIDMKPTLKLLGFWRQK